MSHGKIHYELHISSKEPRLRENKKHKAKTWALEQMKVLLISGAIFIVAFVGLNWQALSTNAVHYYQKWTGFESPLHSVIEVEKEVRATLMPLAAAALPRDRIPPLDISVVPPDARVIIPRINQNVPIVGVDNSNLIARDWGALEQDIQDSLKGGVVHYPGTSLPGEGGHTVLTGHSSYYAWDAGRFKDVFALLHDVEIDDAIVFYYNQKKYTYKVFDIRVVKPEDIDVLAPTKDERLTLITCTPIGTNAKRLVVSAKFVSVE